MFDLKNEIGNAVQEVKICFGDLLGKEKDDVYVVLSEPDTFDCLKLKGRPSEDYKNAEFILSYFKEIFPKYLIDHNFISDGKKADTKDISEFIFRKINISDYVAGEYFKAVFLSPQSNRKER